MIKKIRVGVVFGGKTVEHEVSVVSAKKTIEAMDQDLYEIYPIGITHDGQWMWLDFSLLQEMFAKSGLLSLEGKEYLFKEAVQFNHLKDELDIVFPCLHGAFGEDGCVQGLLKCLDIPFVGCDVLASALCMDKEMSKRILRDAGVPLAEWITVYEERELDINLIIETLKLPVFIKPSNGGSSVGAHVAHTQEEIALYVREAFRYDNKVIIERFIEGKELFVAILGNDRPYVSLPGRLTSRDEFHTYETKYLDPNGFQAELPFKASQEILQEAQELALKAYKALGCRGLTRVDLFLEKDSKLIVNELNTMPGFTPRSLYPIIMEACGISRSEIVNQLIEFGFESYHKASCLQHSFNDALAKK